MKCELTDRQRQIVSRRATGESFKEIAWSLKISLKTVEYHWAKLQMKLGKQDVVAICRWWWERETDVNEI